MPRVLVTGGAGFIGSHLVEALASRDHQIRVLDDLSSGRRSNLPRSGFEFIHADIRDEGLLSSAVAGVDWVFHLAALVSVPASMSRPLDAYDTNLMGSLRLLRAARDEGVKRVVLSSSCAVYGAVAGPAVETHSPQPLSPYAASKWAMEVAGKLFASAYSLPVVSLRYFNVFGPRQRPDSDYAAVIPKFITRMMAGQPPIIHGDGHQTRDFVFVGDVCRANLAAANSNVAAGEVLNVGGGQAVSVVELESILHRYLPDAPSPEHGAGRIGDIRHSEADLTLARRSLGYRPSTDLEAGLQATVEWFQSAPAATADG